MPPPPFAPVEAASPPPIEFTKKLTVASLIELLPPFEPITVVVEPFPPVPTTTLYGLPVVACNDDDINPPAPPPPPLPLLPVSIPPPQPPATSKYSTGYELLVTPENANAVNFILN